MSQDLHDLFATAADGAPTATGLPERVLDRRRRVARRHRTMAAVAGVAVLAVSAPLVLGQTRGETGGTVLVALGPNGTVSVAGPDCRPGEGYSSPVHLEDLPPGRRLRSTDPRYRPAGQHAMRIQDCVGAAVPLSLATTAPDGSVRQALSVSGPLPEPLDLGGRGVAVRGVAGQVVTGNQPNAWEATALAWTDPTGRSWVAQASGYRADELVRTVDRLRITSDGVRLPGTAMTDFGTAPAQAPGRSYEWYASWRDRTGKEYTVRTYTSARTLLGTFTGPRGNSLVTTVAGRPALVASNGLGLGDALQIAWFPLAPGVWAQVEAVDVQPDELVAFAASLVVED